MQKILLNNVRSCLCATAFFCAITAWGQTPTPAPPQSTDGNIKPAAPATQEPGAAATAQGIAGATPECVQPEPVFTGLEYHGPFRKLVVRIAGKPEIRTVHHPHGDTGQVICSLSVRKKFGLFAQDTFEPVTFVIAGFNAGIAQLQNDDPAFGQGAEGFGRRYGAAFADQASGEFFGTFLYPSLFHEDPRYYRLGHGRVPKRVYHAVEHAFVTHSDSGAHQFNFSEWAGAASTSALGNLYHSGNRRGFQPAARDALSSVAFDIAFDIAREFWPEVTQHLRLPFVSHTHSEKRP